MKAALDAVAMHARGKPAAVACIDLASERSFGYAALDRAADGCAALLLHRLAPGDRLAWLGRNSVEMLIAQLGAERAGVIFVPLNWRLAPAELAALTADATPALLIADADFEHIAAKLTIPYFTCGAFGAQITAAPSDATYARAADIDAIATILYTSGTSGRPKGVIQTRRSIFHGMVNFAVANRVTGSSVFLCDMPMFHVAGLFAAVRTPLLMGASVLISPGFEATTTLARLGDPALCITHYFCVTQMAQILRQHPHFHPARLSHLTAFCTGGAPNPPASVRSWIAEGIPMIDGYGMSETGSAIGMPLGDMARIAEKAGSCGLPFLSVETRIVDDTGQDVPEGEVGELWMRGPNISPGYWNRPAETASAFQQGWLKSGDAARCDSDGFYWLMDRRKDMFISGGENVYPAEVEAVILELAEITEAAVIGVADPRWGEVGHAYVVARPDSILTAQTVLDHCGERLARYKIPKSVMIVQTLPRTASGKVQKHILRDALLKA